MCQYCSIQHLSSIPLFHLFFFLSLSASFISDFISSRLVSLTSLPNMTSFFSYIISHGLLPLPSELTHAHMQSRARAHTHTHFYFITLFPPSLILISIPKLLANVLLIASLIKALSHGGPHVQKSVSSDV